MTVTITITGPQGSGKTRWASVLRAVAEASLLPPALIVEEHMPVKSVIDGVRAFYPMADSMVNGDHFMIASGNPGICLAIGPTLYDAWVAARDYVVQGKPGWLGCKARVLATYPDAGAGRNHDGKWIIWASESIWSVRSPLCRSQSSEAEAWKATADYVARTRIEP